MKLMMKASSPHSILDDNSKTRNLLKRFDEINEKYKKILKKAQEDYNGEEILYHFYAGDMSINQYVSNHLMYLYPHKIIFIVYSKGNIANVSLRWEKDIRTPTVNALKHIEGATGGGHENATGARMPLDKIPLFKEKLIEEIEKVKKKSS